MVQKYKIYFIPHIENHNILSLIQRGGCNWIRFLGEVRYILH